MTPLADDTVKNSSSPFLMPFLPEHVKIMSVLPFKWTKCDAVLYNMCCIYAKNVLGLHGPLNSIIAAF